MPLSSNLFTNIIINTKKKEKKSNKEATAATKKKLPSQWSTKQNKDTFLYGYHRRSELQ